VIGVIARAGERPAVQEFFQLFKTPWEYFREGEAYDVLVITGKVTPETQAKLVVCLSETPANHQTKVEIGSASLPIYRAPSEKVRIEEQQRGEQKFVYLGYNLWSEIDYLLRVGQPIDHAQTPALEMHIQVIRNLILDCNMDVVEIPPVPAGYAFSATLTHDIDFIGIRQHKFDHTLAGFLFRSTVGATRDWLRGSLPFSKLMRIWKALASLPFVHLGLARDFWLPFEWYLKVERGIPATYFFIPFKHTPGEKVNAQNAHRRGCAYDIGDIPEWIATLQRNGCEVGVHGIDAWHSVEKGQAERARVLAVTQSTSSGIRMHWLLRNDETTRVLEQAGYEYDSTVGYNETIGYRAGTTQVYLPIGNENLLELPMHIQDGALFYPQRLGLSEGQAWELCQSVIEQFEKFGGVLTLLWHDRSHGPERFWGEFYSRLIERLRQMNVWLTSGEQAVRWFRQRRNVFFEKSGSTISVRGCGQAISPPLTVRVYRGGRSNVCEDFSWDGRDTQEVGELIAQTDTSTAPVGAEA